MSVGMNIFDDPAFSMQEMTAGYNDKAPVRGIVGETLDFDEKGVRTLSVSIESVNGKLNLVEPSPRGGPGEVIDHSKRTVRSFEAAHLKRTENVYADEVQGVRAFGSTTELMQVQQLVDDKLDQHRRDFDLTHEYMKFGAINGHVVSGKGVSILNIYAEFGLAAPANVLFNLGSDAFKVRDAADDLRGSMEDDLVGATTYGGIVAFCGQEFFKKLSGHKEVRETYLNTASAVELRGQMPDAFNYGGITWIRYRTAAKAKAANGGAPFLATDEARVCFKGVPGLYLSRFAPAPFWDAVNTPGLPLYVRENKKDRSDESASFQIQSNPLHLITQPKTLRRLKIGA